MTKHPHHSRYARLVAGFAASAFALLITNAVHFAEARQTPLTGEVTASEVDYTKDCARTRKTLDKCSAREVKCITKAAARQPVCIQKTEAKMVKCSEKAVKKLNECQAKAQTPEKQASCSRKFDEARRKCGESYDTARLRCGTAESAATACANEKLECESDALESFTDKTGVTYDIACKA